MPDDGDRDEPEIEVVAQPRPRPVRRRTPNPVADEVIHSGEIDTAPRSMVVRSLSNMPVVRDDEPTAVSAPMMPVAPAARGIGALVVLGVLAVVVGGGGVALAMLARSPRDSGPPPQQTADLQTAADMLGAIVDADVRAALVRAEAIATAPALRNAIETDAQTLADMVRDSDLKLSIEQGEQIEIIQLRDGVRIPMLSQPPGAAPLAAPPPGKARLEVRGDVLAVVATAAVAKQNSGIGGEVTFAAPVDLARVRQRVGTGVQRLALVGLAKPLVLVAGKTDGTHVMQPVAAKLSDTPALSLDAVIAAAVVAPADDPRTLRLARDACFALAGLLVVVFGVVLVRRR